MNHFWIAHFVYKALGNTFDDNALAGKSKARLQLETLSGVTRTAAAILECNQHPGGVCRSGAARPIFYSEGKSQGRRGDGEEIVRPKPPTLLRLLDTKK
ncbi:hypothetical protein Zmor_024871 [Zophobas morio]|uniref:Uncharacterized protein n=1 Tax=Zophobas morio TaxID=2755281 RepID=A0AA38M329_9CUCU|nr:hypothetical protein Zmor_024871 [Zophobas morio]